MSLDNETHQHCLIQLNSPLHIPSISVDKTFPWASWKFADCLCFSTTTGCHNRKTDSVYIPQPEKILRTQTGLCKSVKNVRFSSKQCKKMVSFAAPTIPLWVAYSNAISMSICEHKTCFQAITVSKKSFMHKIFTQHSKKHNEQNTTHGINYILYQ